MLKNLLPNLYVAVLTLLLSGAAGSAAAAVQTFGPEYQRFTIEVPEGWQTLSRETGVQLTEADGTNSVDVQVNQNPEHMPMRQIVEAVAAKIGNATIEENEGYYVIKAEVDGTRLAVMLYGDDKMYAAVTMAGDDAEVLSQIVNSIDFPTVGE